MTPVMLLQMGVLKHLRDPRLTSFNSDKINSSDVELLDGRRQVVHLGDFRGHSVVLVFLRWLG